MASRRSHSKRSRTPIDIETAAGMDSSLLFVSQAMRGVSAAAVRALATSYALAPASPPDTRVIVDPDIHTVTVRIGKRPKPPDPGSDPSHSKTMSAQLYTMLRQLRKLHAKGYANAVWHLPPATETTLATALATTTATEMDVAQLVHAVHSDDAPYASTNAPKMPAPEQELGCPPSQATDVWQLGWWFCITRSSHGDAPASSCEVFGLPSRQSALDLSCIDRWRDGFRSGLGETAEGPTAWVRRVLPEAGVDVQAVLASLLCPDPASRATAATACRHSMFSKLRRMARVAVHK